MTVIASYLYRDGHRAEPFDINAGSSPQCSNEFVWIGLHDPDEAELRTIQKTFGLHRLSVEDALNGKQVPKVDVYGDHLFVFIKTAHLEGDVIDYGETALFLGPHHVITVRHGSDRGHSALREQLEASPDLLRNGPDYVLHGVLDFIVDGYLPVVQTIEDKVLSMEQRMLDAFLGRDQIKRLFRLRRQIIRFQRVLGPVSELCGKLVHLDLPCVDDEAKKYFKDVHDHIRRVESMVGGLKDIITSVFEASNLLEQQRVGAIQRQLAAWAAIAAIPTAIAGIYGMNFDNMPELKTQYGYFVVLAVIFSLCGILFWRFRNPAGFSRIAVVDWKRQRTSHPNAGDKAACGVLSVLPTQRVQAAIQRTAITPRQTIPTTEANRRVGKLSWVRMRR